MGSTSRVRHPKHMTMNSTQDAKEGLSAPVCSALVIGGLASVLAQITHLSKLHARAENLGWDGGTDAYRAAQELFNVAAWNHGPMLLDELRNRIEREIRVLSLNAAGVKKTKARRAQRQNSVLNKEGLHNT